MLKNDCILYEVGCTQTSEPHQKIGIKIIHMARKKDREMALELSDAFKGRLKVDEKVESNVLVWRSAEIVYLLLGQDAVGDVDLLAVNFAENREHANWQG